MVSLLKRVLIGRPIATAEEGHQRLRKRVALPIFASDAMSSTAYATDEIPPIKTLVATTITIRRTAITPSRSLIIVTRRWPESRYHSLPAITWKSLFGKAVTAHPRASPAFGSAYLLVRLRSAFRAPGATVQECLPTMRSAFESIVARLQIRQEAFRAICASETQVCR